MTNDITFENVNITIKNKKILENINLYLKKNTFVFLTGKIGTGKTSLLRSIYGDLPIKTGKAIVLDYNLISLKIKQIPYLRRNIGYVFQDFKFLNDRNISMNLRFVLEAMGWIDNKKISERIEEVLTDIEMTHKIESMPYELSGGEIQRIAVARAILNNPKIILADEPTGNLDEESSIYITKKIYEQTKNGASVIFVTHNPTLAKHIEKYEKWEINNLKIQN